MRGKDYHPSYSPSRPQVYAMARRRLRLVRVRPPNWRSVHHKSDANSLETLVRQTPALTWSISPAFRRTLRPTSRLTKVGKSLSGTCSCPGR